MFLSHAQRIYNRFTKISTHFYSTIYALSSGKGKCGVAVIRISGESCREVLTKLVNCTALPKPRTALLRRIRDPITNDMIDRGLVLWFPGPASFTGEDCCELHVHGSIAVVNNLLLALGKLENCRLAEPGEFTRRAFYNGKLDLVEIEGLADLLNAETEQQLKQALLQTEGTLSKLYNKWRSDLIRNLAHLEAYIDFDETEGLESNILITIKRNVQIIVEDIHKHLTDGVRGERLRSGVKTVIIGKPNVGKSSLLNLLCKQPKAIVTSIAGTTRDVLESALDINGYPILLVDTAGLRTSTEDIIEQEGIKRTVMHSKQADLILLMIDGYDLLLALKSGLETVSSYILKYLNELGISDNRTDEIFKDKNRIYIINKIDLLNSHDQQYLSSKLNNHKDNYVVMSCLEKTGSENLISALTDQLKMLCGSPSFQNPILAQVRHRLHLERCKQLLNEFVAFTENQQCDTVLIAEKLRAATNQIGKITGVVTTEQLLDVIFKEFCIGK